MGFPAIAKFKANAVTVATEPVFRTQEARQVAERFENVKNIADPDERANAQLRSEGPDARDEGVVAHQVEAAGHQC